MTVQKEGNETYIRQETIGRGAWSVVYRALDTVTGEIVAVKELIDPASVPKREVAIGRRVTHANVCRYHDYFINENDSNCVAMEFAAGGNLRAFLEKSGPLSIKDAMRGPISILSG